MFRSVQWLSLVAKVEKYKLNVNYNLCINRCSQYTCDLCEFKNNVIT